MGNCILADFDATLNIELLMIYHDLLSVILKIYQFSKLLKIMTDKVTISIRNVISALYFVRNIIRILIKLLAKLSIFLARMHQKSS